MKIYVLSLFVSLGAGCKKLVNTGGVRSVEAVISGDMSKRSAAGTLCGDSSLPNETAMDAVRRVYDAAPINLRFSGETAEQAVIVTDDLEKECRATLQAAATDEALRGALAKVKELPGCWKTGANGKLVIVMPNDKDKIHLNLLPMIYYRFAEAIDVLTQQPDTKVDKPTYVNFAHAFARARAKVAQAIADDLKELVAAGIPSAKESLALYEATFGWKQGSADIPVAMQNFLLAEFVDSHYCSAQTSQTLDLNGFGDSKKIFLEFAQNFGGVRYLPL